MEIKKNILINSSIAHAWQILGHDFAHPYKWASSVNHSEGKGEPTGSISCDERACKTVMGNIREKLTHYSDEEHTLAYDITEGLPVFVKTGKNTWHLEEIDDHTTELHIHMEFSFKSWAGWMSSLMGSKMKQMVQELAEDFTHYAEKGKPHPRKVKAQAKANRNLGLLTFYLLTFFIGTAVPLYFIIGFIQANGGIDLRLFIDQLFANRASSTFSSDLLICSAVFWVFMAFEKNEKGVPSIFLFILLNLTIGLSSALPLYLYFREKANRIVL